MLNARVFYNGEDFFGGWKFNQEDVTDICDEPELKSILNKCFSGFEKRACFAFRIEAVDTNGEFYLIERTFADKLNDVFTVTHRVSNLEIDAPVKMSKASIRRIVNGMFKKYG